MPDSFSKQLKKIQDQIDGINVLAKALSGFFERTNGTCQAIEGHISNISGDYSAINSAAERIDDGQRELRPGRTSLSQELRRNPFSE